MNRNRAVNAKAGHGTVYDDASKIRNGWRYKRMPIGNSIHFGGDMSFQAGIDLLEQNCIGRNQCHQFLRAAAGFIRLAIPTTQIDAEDGRRIGHRCTDAVKTNRNFSRKPTPGEGGGRIKRTGQVIGKNQQHGRNLKKSCNVFLR
jgi:hypothetical protein